MEEELLAHFKPTNLQSIFVIRHICLKALLLPLVVAQVTLFKHKKTCYDIFQSGETEMANTIQKSWKNLSWENK